MRQALRGISVALLFGLSAGAHAGGSKVTLSDLRGTRGLPGGGVAASANGRLIAVERDGVLAVIWKKRKLSDLGDGLSPSWAPDGKNLGFLSRRSGSLQIWVWNSETKALKRLTDLPGGINADPTTRVDFTVLSASRIRWSPQGAAITFASRVATARPNALRGEPIVLDNSSTAGLASVGVLPAMGLSNGVAFSADGRSYSVKAWDGSTYLYSQIFKVDLSSGSVTQLTNDLASDYFSPDWSADGKVIYAARSHRSVGSLSFGDMLWNRPGELRSDVIALDSREGRPLFTAQTDGVATSVTSLQGGRYIAFILHQSALAPGTVYVIDLSQQGLRPIPVASTARGADRPFELDRASRDAFNVYSCDQRCSVRLITLGTASIDTRDVLVNDDIDAWSSTKDGTLLWQAQDALRSKAPSGKVRTLRREDDDRRFALGKLVKLQWTNSRGDELSGSLLLPYGARKGKPLPLIIDTYPMVDGGSWMSPHQGNQAWASMGYAIFRPLLRAPNAWMNTVRSEKFSVAGKGSAGWELTLDDLMSGIDRLSKSGWIDRSRMCLFGHSNGGGVAAAVISRTTEFRCAVILAPNSVDIVSPTLLSPEGRSQYFELTGKYIEQDPLEYVGTSTAFRLAKTRTPVLLAVGDDDTAFLLNSIALYNGLRAANSPVQFIRYPGQGHYIFGPSLQDLWKRETEFFAKYLGDVQLR